MMRVVTVYGRIILLDLLIREHDVNDEGHYGMIIIIIIVTYFAIFA
jgi:hypothetical protein